MSRVSSRTLRHYDHIGLLPPARTGHGGLRYYERPQLQRLQHILVLRELGLRLDDIGAVLDGEVDEVASLRRHHERLLAEAERLRTLADTVARSIDEREDGPEMAVEELFDGFRNDPYAAQARELYGETAVEAQRRAASWDGTIAGRVKDEGDAVHRDLAAAMQANTPADHPAVQQIVGRHHAWVSNFWTPGRDAYLGLGELYVDDERFTANIDATAPGLAVYLRDAMTVYAQEQLS